jgi:spore coat protein U-like protein
MKCNLAGIAGVGVLGLMLGAGAASAATATGTFQSRITIVAECEVVTTNTLNFGNSVGLLTANVDATAQFSVQCTNSTDYDIGLNAGTTAGGTTATRLMTDGSATVSYQMFSNAARTTNWGDTVGTDTISDTGTGSSTTYTIFGRVPAQVTPAPATYTDTVTITITY